MIPDKRTITPEKATVILKESELGLQERRLQKAMAPKEPIATIMKSAFKELATGRYTVEQVYKEAKDKGLPCGRNNFHKMVRNPVYCGKIIVPKYKDEGEQWVDGQHEPLISENVFYQVQEALDRNGRKQTRTTIASPDNLPLRAF